jgi:hypothetical protein
MPAPFPSPTDFRDTLRQQYPDLPDINEPGFAATYDYNAVKEKLWNYAPLATVGGLGAALWYLNQQRPSVKAKAIAKKKRLAPVPAEKTADLKEVLENIRWHLPKLRVPDTVAGGLAGAGVGGLYDLIRGKDKKGKRQTLKRVLTGALTGAGLSNIVGDRFRRYIANTKIPMGYRPTATKEITPSLKRIWNAAILDKQDFDEDAMKYWGTNKATGETDPLKQLPARMELVRRQFGLPVDKANPWWQKNPEGYYSLNEKSPEYADRLKTLFSSKTHVGLKRDSLSSSGPEQLLKDPETALRTFNKYPSYQPNVYDFFGVNQLMGGMQVPYVKTPDGKYQGMVLDRWDVTPSKLESEYFKKNLGKFLTDSKWREAPLSESLGWYTTKDTGHTNSSTMKTIGGRWVWDNILSDELPWVGQKFEVAPRQDNYTWKENMGGNRAPFALQFLKADNSPATPAMGYAALDAWDKNK